MTDYSENKNRIDEGIKDEKSYECSREENLELFKRALSEAAELKMRKLEKEIENTELPPPSKRHKIRMNRIFRERVGGAFLPFPEVDNFYEKARSKLIVKFKINEFIDRCEERDEVNENGVDKFFIHACITSFIEYFPLDSSRKKSTRKLVSRAFLS